MPRAARARTANDRLQPLELFCFGPPRAKLSGEDPPTDVTWRKHLALLIYLALSSDRTRTREHLVGLLWPEKAEERARHSLNEALRRLRVSLGADRIVSRGETVTLTGDHLEVDVLRFEDELERDQREAMRLVTGEFLDGFSLDDAPEFDLWVSRERRRFHTKVAPLLLADAEHCLAASRLVEAQEGATRALALQPYYEPAVRLLMRAAALTGDQAGALAAFRDFERRLKDELHETASRELTDLAERIRNARWRQVTVSYADPEPPLIGRQDSHEEAFRLLAEGLANGPRSLLITGDPGMGRTRLLTECTNRLILDGAVVASARPLESDHDAAWSTLRGLMRAGLLTAPGLAATDSMCLRVLASIVPELAERVTATEPQDRAQVGSSLAALLTAVAEETPVCLAIDDAHLADGMTLGALNAAMTQIQSLPVILIVSSRSSPATVPRELLRLQSDIGRNLPGRSVRLGALTADEIRALVESLAEWCEGDEEIDRLTRRLQFETSGDPFLAVTLLRGLGRVDWLRERVSSWPKKRATLDTPLPMAVPDMVRLTMTARVNALSKECQAVLVAASIAGGVFDLDLIAQLADLSPKDAEKQLPELERHRLVDFDGERYTFTAPMIAQVIQAEFVTHGQKQMLRKRAVGFLSQRTDLESRILRAELMAKTDPGLETFDEVMAVARAAFESDAYRSVRRALRVAERVLGEEDDERRLQVEALKKELEKAG